MRDIVFEFKNFSYYLRVFINHVILVTHLGTHLGKILIGYKFGWVQCFSLTGNSPLPLRREWFPTVTNEKLTIPNFMFLTNWEQPTSAGKWFPKVTNEKLTIPHFMFLTTWEQSTSAKEGSGFLKLQMRN